MAFEDFRKRMSRYGQYQGEQMRKQTEMVMDATWMNSTSVRPVQVQYLDTGLPPTYESAEDFEEPLYAHFEPHAKFNVTGDEVDYYVTFRPGEMHAHPEIRAGAYVCIPDANGLPVWWLIMHQDDDNLLKKCQVLKCNWTFRWVTDGKIYACLGCQRYAQSYNSGSWAGDRVDFTDNITSAWLPCNSDTNTIGYNQRMIISNEGRYPPICWAVSKIETTTPVGIAKIRFTQEDFDPTKDNAGLGLANYYDRTTPPVESSVTTQTDIDITYSGSKPTIKVGGSYKTFTAQLPEENHFDIMWSVVDGDETYGSNTYDNATNTYGDYIMTTTDRTMQLKVAQNYDLVGKVLTIQANCADGHSGSIQVEVVA